MNLSESARLPRTDLSRREILLLFIALAAIVGIPIFTHPLPPLSDYVNHLARMHVIEAIKRDPNLARYYEIDWQIIPNLMMDLVVPVLARFMNIYLAGEIFIFSMFMLIMSGTMALHRALFGRWSALPMVGFPSDPQAGDLSLPVVVHRQQMS